MTLRVIRPGLLTTLQDGGRHGWQHLGVVPCGAMDPVALELANALVGNKGGEAALEITVLGPELAFECDALVALGGAETEARIGNELVPLNRPVLIGKGSTLKTGRMTRGSRAYLAVAGGFGTAPVLGSRSTCLPARFGGHEGRALKVGDALPFAQDVSLERFEKLKSKSTPSFRTVSWSVPVPTLPEHEPIVVHAMPGRHLERFDATAQRAFFEATWKITPDSNRMGFRLAGPTLALAEAGEILSEPTCLGTVQVPANGLPIALMADHQTTGGYPKIAEIASADVPRLAQLAPGGTLRFALCTLEQAQELRRALRLRIDASLRSLEWNYGA